MPLPINVNMLGKSIDHLESLASNGVALLEPGGGPGNSDWGQGAGAGGAGEDLDGVAGLGQVESEVGE